MLHDADATGFEWSRWPPSNRHRSRTAASVAAFPLAAPLNASIVDGGQTISGGGSPKPLSDSLDKALVQPASMSESKVYVNCGGRFVALEAPLPAALFC